MADYSSSSTDKESQQPGDSLATQLVSLLSNLQTSQPDAIHNQHSTQSISINIKLNQFNFSLWSRLMKMEIGGRGKLSHLTGNPPPPEAESPVYTKWEQTDLIVCTWLLRNMEPELVTVFAEYPSAKALWDGLNSTYSQSSDGLQIFDLTVRANNMRQGTDSIEKYYGNLQRIWREIEVRQPNPMTCERDIATFNRLRSETQLFQFLAGVDDRHEPERRDLLKEDPLPSVEKAYATIRREGNRREILGFRNSSSASDTGIGAGLIAGKQGQQGRTGGGRDRKPKIQGGGPPRTPPAARSSFSGGTNAGNGGPPQCNHCKRMGHTEAGCYEIIGWPDGWQSRRRDNTLPAYGAAAVATAGGNQSAENERGEQMKEAASAKGEKGAAFLGKGIRWQLPSYPSPTYSVDFTPPCNYVPVISNSFNPVPKFLSSSKRPISPINCKMGPNIHENKTGTALQTSTYPNPDKSRWIFDCGATDTMTYDRSDLDDYTIPPRNGIVNASGGILDVHGAGTVTLSPHLKLKNCLYIPSLSCKLLSISQVTKQLNCMLLMFPSFCLLQDIRSGKVIGRGTEERGLYYVDEVAQHGTAALAHGTVDRQQWLWHRRLGHASSGYLQLLFPQFFPKDFQFTCDTCALAKSHRQSYPVSSSRSETIFSLVHSDVWGPAPVSTSIHGFKYFVLFIDDCTRMTWVYFLKNKSDVSSKFVEFYHMVKNQFKSHIQVLRSDNGGEYVNSTLKQFFCDNGLIHQTSCPHTPQQNGVAERRNRHLLEMSRALLIESHCPSYMWPEAVASSVYLVNRLPSKPLHLQTPLQCLSKRVSIPSVLTIPPRVFGCSVFVHIPKASRSKLDPCSIKCVFVGYGVHQKGYRCFDPTSRQIYTTMDCDFVETEYYFTAPLSGQGENQQDPLSGVPPLSWPDTVLPEQVGGTTEPPPPMVQSASPVHSNINPTNTPEVSKTVNSSTSVIPYDDNSAGSSEEKGEIETDGSSAGRYVLPPRSTRGVPPKRYEPDHVGRTPRYPVANIVRRNLAPQALTHNSAIQSIRIPSKVEEALEDERWVKAMEVEMEALRKNGTWEKCTIPTGKKAVGCRWVFTVKHRADGSIERYKARLVAKGYTQTYGIDYSETFSPVAKIDTIRVLLSVAANRDWHLHQFDVKNAFLHGDLQEEVYMDPPPGFTREFSSKEVCRLKKALYGLKQSPRAWFGRFSAAMKKYGYVQSNSDHTLFIKRRGELVTCLIIYVDDMIITGDDQEEITQLRGNLSREFEMKDLGPLKYFLGIEVLRSKRGIYISQRKFVLDLLAETGLLECKPADTPMVVNQGLRIVEGAEETEKSQYQHLVGKLIYLAHTRPDIAYAVGVLSQFMHKPQQTHMEAALRVCRYLKGCPGRGVIFQKNGHLEVEAYTDADWAGSPSDRRSTSGYFALVGGNVVTWKSKKQKVVALSSAEAEFRGVARGVAEVLWLRKLLTEIGIPPTRRCRLMCDNRAAISISENPVQHDRTKHVEVDRHFIKEKIEEGVIELPFVRSEDQLADILTKAVNGRIFNEVLGKLQIGDPTLQLEGEC